MKLIYTILIFIASKTQICFGQSEILWEVTNPKNTEKSYLFGTIHSGDSKLFPIDSIIYKSLFKCDLLALEINPSEMNDINVLKKMLLDEKNIEDLFSKKNYELITTFLKDSLNVSEIMVKNMQPIFIQQLIDQSVYKNEHDPIDLHLYKNALINNISIEGLETIEEQMNTLLSIPLKKQADDLLDKVKKFNSDEIKKEMNSMIYAYINRDIENFVINELKKNKNNDFEENFIYSRNIKMFERANQKLNNNTVFIAVGAAHLYGEKGLINLLKKEGYILNPIF